MVAEHEAFVARHQLEGMTQVVDDDGSLWAYFGVSYQPAWVFVDDDGTATLIPGALGPERLVEQLDALVAA